jgi:ACT domain-containing protein
MTDSKSEEVRAACEHLVAAGRDVTFAAVAQTAGISRATCYRNRDLRAVIDTYRSRHGELLTITTLANRVDNLTQALNALADKIRRQEEEIRSLKRQTAMPWRSNEHD